MMQRHSVGESWQGSDRELRQGTRYFDRILRRRNIVCDVIAQMHVRTSLLAAETTLMCRRNSVYYTGYGNAWSERVHCDRCRPATTSNMAVE